MGAIDIGGEFKAYDWKSGIKAVQDEAEAYYGYDPYNGAANNVSFSYDGDKSNLSKKELEKYERNLLEKLGKRQGVVFKKQSLGFKVITTKYTDTNEVVILFSVRQIDNILKMYKGPAVLVTTDNNGGILFVANGKIKELKEQAHKLLRKEYYRRNYIILKKDQNHIVCTGVEKSYKTTTKKTDDKHLVLEYNLYGYIGLAPC